MTNNTMIDNFDFELKYPAGSRLAKIMNTTKHKHHRSGYAECRKCANLLAENETLNVYWCKTCRLSSIATKPTEYENCPCGAEITKLRAQDNQ